MGTYYCPNGFQVHPSNAQLCVVECPRDKGYELRLKDQQPACVYKNDETIFVPLKSVNALQVNDSTPNALTVDDLNQGSFGQKILAQFYFKAKSEFDTDFVVKNGNIETSKKVLDAFKALQDAENVRDQSPQAYQDARVRYYTLLKGDQWLEEEKQRLAKNELNPTIIKIVNTYNDLTNRIRQQSDTIQIVDGVKDKLGSLRDEFRYSVGTFGKQVQELKNQIQIERKKKEKEKISTTSWISTLLNVLIVIFLAIAILLIIRRIFVSKPITSNSNT